jgi:hypothetical protein
MSIPYIFDDLISIAIASVRQRLDLAERLDGGVLLKWSQNSVNSIPREGFDLVPISRALKFYVNISNINSLF